MWMAYNYYPIHKLTCQLIYESVILAYNNKHVPAEIRQILVNKTYTVTIKKRLLKASTVESKKLKLNRNLL